MRRVKDLRISDHAIKRYRQRVHKRRHALKDRDIVERIRQMVKRAVSVAATPRGQVVLECKLRDGRRFYLIVGDYIIITLLTEDMFKESIREGDFKLLP